MHYSCLYLLSLLGLSTALPSRTHLAPRCGTTSTPFLIQQLTEADPTAVGPNTLSSNNGDFLVSQEVDAYGNIINRVYTIAAFEGIPAGSYGCQLGATFPSTATLTSSGNPTLNVTTLFVDSPSEISYPNTWSWDTFSPPASPPLGQGLFGTVNLQAGTTQVINSEACPIGGGSLAFLFEIASWIEGEASVEFDQYVNNLNGAGLTGVYLTYDC